MNLTRPQFKEIVREVLAERLVEYHVKLEDEEVEDISDSLLEKIEEAEVSDGSDEDE